MALEYSVELRGSFLPQCDSQHTELPHFGNGKTVDSHETPQKFPKMTVWCGFTTTFILGPFFFEEFGIHAHATCSVTGRWHHDMLQNSVP
ncbi:hypothetical protein TNCV_1293001 [Trichonephila clavipes]|nr:hypothetical protein TNCV_1293001 [Trichonephila clavipes]